MKADKLEPPLLNFFVLYTDKKKSNKEKRKEEVCFSNICV